MRRLFIILSFVLLVFGALAWCLVFRGAAGAGSQLALTVTKITSHSGPPARDLLGWTAATNRAVTVRSATVTITNVGKRVVEVFPMYSIETNSNDLHPRRSTPAGLRGPLRPGQSCAVEVFLGDLGDQPWRVGFWYSEVRPAWFRFLRDCLGRVGLSSPEEKSLAYSDWHRSAGRP